MNFANPIAIQAAGMSTELTMLAIAVVLGMFQLLIAARAGNSQRGLRWNVGARDEAPKSVGKGAARLERAFRNFLETFPFFAAVVLIAAVAGRHNGATVWGAELYVAGRIVYLPLYAFGVPVLRTLVWLVATAGILLIAAALFWPNI
jgi:uncharacterized MAPEG superfamily protein